MPTAMTFNNKAITFGSTPAWLSISSVDPYNPLGLPPFTIRCQFSSGYVPAVGDSRTLVDAGENIWDIYKSSDEWTGLLSGRAELLAVVGANTTGVTDMGNMFKNCTSLTSIPLFDTGSATSMDYMFYSCLNVESGALALYQQASQQTTPPTSYSYCFTNCGSNTVTGAAELAQISTDWGGTNYEEELG